MQENKQPSEIQGELPEMAALLKKLMTEKGIPVPN